MDALTISAIAIFLGVFVRTGMVYLKKFRDAEKLDPPQTLKFDTHYLITAVTALVISFTETMLLLPAFSIPGLDIAPLLAFSNGFGFGFTSNSILNEIIS